MRKANIILTALTVLSVVGMVFAFKTQRFRPANGITSYTTTNTQGIRVTLCTIGTHCLTNQGIPANTYTTFNLSNHICGPVVATFTEACD